MGWGPDPDGLIRKLLPNPVTPEPITLKAHKRAQRERNKRPAEEGP